ncbi:MAG: hypothetical protein JOZ69_06015 [Myxococcales bacterium]|nr:hypothetical protein [Myxococcales bacterium]
MSRYYDAARALRVDEATSSSIERLDADNIGDEQVCGAAALRATLRVARQRGMRAARLALRHCGSADEVVGFGAFAVG